VNTERGTLMDDLDLQEQRRVAKAEADSANEADVDARIRQRASVMGVSYEQAFNDLHGRGYR